MNIKAYILKVIIKNMGWWMGTNHRTLGGEGVISYVKSQESTP